MAQDLYASAVRALEQGHGEEAVDLLVPALKKPDLSRDDTAQFRCALAEAWLLQDDLEKAAIRPGPAAGRTRAAEPRPALGSVADARPDRRRPRRIVPRASPS